MPSLRRSSTGCGPNATEPLRRTEPAPVPLHVPRDRSPQADPGGGRDRRRPPAVRGSLRTRHQALLRRRGLGPKQVAPAFGFSWRDESPSGLLSQGWYFDAIQIDDPDVAAAARERLLTYNEDDVRATLAVRRGWRWKPRSRTERLSRTSDPPRSARFRTTTKASAIGRASSVDRASSSARERHPRSVQAGVRGR